MAEDSHPSRYVKLTRDQDAPAEDIRPGELNQPVHVPQVGFSSLSLSSSAPARDRDRDSSPRSSHLITLI
jgi:hypothetical protein